MHFIVIMQRYFVAGHSNFVRRSAFCQLFLASFLSYDKWSLFDAFNYQPPTPGKSKLRPRFFLPNWKWLFLGCRQFLLLVGLRRGDEKTITNVSDIINGESKKYFQGFYSWGRVFNEANFKCFPQKWRELWQLSENRFELQVSRAWLCPFFALYFLIFMLLLPLQLRVSRYLTCFKIYQTSRNASTGSLSYLCFWFVLPWSCWDL